ncbi:VOC family protein [Alkalihalobacillus sp. BA299]|uniref:VOC family protein n=1 Tax=Alkalihalobacillus sp. BA299 TaxID=2815938 RepID=UPI001ADA3D0E|nr:VOC family protein [Alkalihalobacillus sp. BA299]
MGTNEPLLGNNTLNQIAFVVEDIEATRDAFAKLLGIPKPEWFLTAPSKISKVVYNGQPSEARSKLVFINTPSVQIELIEPNPEPSTMREYLDTVGEGIHHIAFDVDAVKLGLETMDQEGFPLVQTGEFTSSNGKYAYVDTLDTHKTLIELLEREEAYKPLESDGKNEKALLGTDKLTQIAIVVCDLHKAADHYCKLLGVEKPAVIPSGKSEITHITFRGEPTEAKGQFMFINTPLIQLELIEPALDSPSTWKEHLETKGEGIHHISFVVDNLDDKIKILEEMGYPVIQKGNFWNNRGRYAYMDTTSTFKVIIELLEKYEV